MWHGCPPALDMEDSPVGHGQRVGDERSVAAPGDGPGAHDRRWALGGERLETAETGREGLRLHVVGETFEGGVAPTEIDQISPSAAEPSRVLRRM